ncbi:MAG: acetate/propionate family kinase [Pseudomonadota bacterium]|nr:acetate/propionate family kinase [Pseudomonadota bacterium]
MTDALLTLNAGSSSLKFAVFDPRSLACHGRGGVEALGGDARLHFRPAEGEAMARELGRGGGEPHLGALTAALGLLGERLPGLAVRAVGHRIVHGGADYSAPAPIDDAVYAALAKLEPLAPLHQPHNLAGVRAARALFPQAAQIACFDTAFHHGHAFVADAYALPREMVDAGLRRYGFHGLSYEYVAGRLREIAPEVADGRVIIAHLGNGASMCALREGRSVATTMGFSTLDGLPMGTRPGQLDPGVLLYLMTAKGYDAAGLNDLLYHRSGLKGLSGVSNDWREIEAAGTARARDAIAYFVHRLVYEIGGLTATLGGLDALVFTGGIGENATALRAAVAARLGWLGLALDEAANAAARTRISTPASRLAMFVAPTDEERQIAGHTAKIAFG